MKTTQLNALMTVLAVLFFAKTHDQDDFVLKGKIGESNAPAKLFLEYMVDEKQMVDSTILEEGRFEFQGKINNSSAAKLRLAPEGSSYEQPLHHYETSFILNKGTTEMEGEDLEDRKSTRLN